MKKLILYGFPTVLLLLVLLYIATFLVQINRVKELPKPLQKERVEVNDTLHATKDWRKALEKSKNSDDFYYPVQEIVIALDMQTPVEAKHKNRIRHFKLITEPLDDYQYFCLTQVLEQLKVMHKIQRYHNDVGVVLYAKELDALKSITDELKAYNIKSSIKQIKGN